MAVYRMKFAPDVKAAECVKGTNFYDACRNEIFENFLEHNFIGTGWEELPLAAGMTDEEIKKVINGRKLPIESIRNICRVHKDDLIWVIRNSNYFLFKVAENRTGSSWMKDTFGYQSKWFSERDIAHCFTGEWLEIGNEVNIPGIVINNMGVGSTLREIKRGSELSKLVWNKFSRSNYYEIGRIDENDFWNMLTDRQVEGLVMTYIQIRYDCIVNTESLKHSTAVYECELITKNGIHYYPQVKTGSSGDKEFPVENYCIEIKKTAKQTGHASVPVLFYENEDYGEYDEYGLIKIYRSELMKFIERNKNLISDSVLQTYELISK